MITYDSIDCINCKIFLLIKLILFFLVLFRNKVHDFFFIPIKQNKAWYIINIHYKICTVNKHFFSRAEFKYVINVSSSVAIKV